MRSPSVAAMRVQPVNGLEQLSHGKFALYRKTRIGVIGGSFAQQSAQSLKARGYLIGDEEPPPQGLSPASAQRFGYLTHSVRSGNLGAPRQLLQLVREARGEFAPTDGIWVRKGRFFDAMRLSVEPNGLARPETVANHRAWHLSRVKRLLETSDVLLLGLEATEACEHVTSGTLYPVAPGQIAGARESATHRMRSFTQQEMYDDLTQLFALCKETNPAMRFLLAVPAELSAEKSGTEAAQLTDLREVAGRLYGERDDVDYVPDLSAGTDAEQKANGAGDTHSGQAMTEEERAALDDEELERMLAGDDLCEEILNETFKP